MKDPILIIAAVMLGTVSITWVAGRLVARVDDLLTAISAVTVRVCLAVIFALSASRAAMRGGYAWIEASICGLFALGSVGMAAAMIWVWAHEGLPDSADPGGRS